MPELTTVVRGCLKLKSTWHVISLPENKTIHFAKSYTFQKKETVTSRAFPRKTYKNIYHIKLLCKPFHN